MLVDINAQFAEVVRDAADDPFDAVRRFRAICSTKALQVRDEPEFEAWSLETKLWHLVEVLYSLRLAEPEPLAGHSWSSVAVKEDLFTRNNRQLAEMGHIISWVQFNSEAPSTEIPAASKWRHTRVAAQTQSLGALAQREQDDTVSHLDADAPLRARKKIHADDSSVDRRVFQVIYELLVADRIDDAIRVAHESGNFTLAMILIGYIRPFFDPVLDSEYLEAVDAKDVATTAAGAKHPLLWRKTVYKLAQSPFIDRYEKMIYNFLAGGDISLNINDTASWDKRLLLYCSQAVISAKLQFYESTFAADPSENLPVAIPPPAVSTIDDILNTLQMSGGEVAEQAKNPLRTITGAVMIRKVASILAEAVSDANVATNPLVLDSPSILRVLAHLAVFLTTTGAEQIDTPLYNRIVSKYISKLLEAKHYDLIPTYMTFLLDESEARESYSKILAAIDDPDLRAKQVALTRKLAYFRAPLEGPTTADDRMAITLRRTVERIIADTDAHYQPAGQVVVQDGADSIDDTDRKLSQSVEWFTNNNMHEDTIIASLVIIKRFLLSGKLAALKAFASDKKFKKIIVDYDSETETKLLDNRNFKPAVSDDDKEELLSYNSFVEGLVLIDEWNTFVAGSGASAFVKGTDVSHSVEKTTKKLHTLISTWLVNADKPILREFRHLYVPYLIIALMGVYEQSRHSDWRYMEKSFDLIKKVANEDENDLLRCFSASGRLGEFLKTCGQLALVAGEKGVKGIFI